MSSESPALSSSPSVALPDEQWPLPLSTLCHTSGTAGSRSPALPLDCQGCGAAALHALKYAPPADRLLRRLPRSKEKRLLKTMKFPKEYELKVDLTRVNWEVMKVWIAQRVTELLGVEDDVLIGYVYEQLEGHKASTCSFLHYSCCICSKHMLQTRRTGLT